MPQMSLFEKLGLLWDALISSPILLLVTGAISLVFGYFWFQKEERVKTKQHMILFYTIFLVFLLLQSFDTMISFGNQVIKELLEIYYFPSLSILTISFIAFHWYNFVTYQKEENNVKKAIALVSSFLSFILLAVFFEQLVSGEIDITNETTLYTNETVLAIIELLMITIFVSVIAQIIFRIYRVLAQDEGASQVTVPSSIAVDVKEPMSKSRKHSSWKDMVYGMVPKVETKANGAMTTLMPVVNLYEQDDKVITDTVIPSNESIEPVVSTHELEIPSTLRPIVEQESIVKQVVENEQIENQEQVVMQQGIPIIMNLEDYYTKDPLDDIEIDIEKELYPERKKTSNIISKLVPVIEKKEDTVAVEMKPVISRHEIEEHVLKPKEEVMKEHRKEPEVKVELNEEESKEPSLFNQMFQEPSFYSNDEIMRLRAEYDAIDDEINALEQKKRAV